jgi:hypothetical protein
MSTACAGDLRTAIQFLKYLLTRASEAEALQPTALLGTVSVPLINLIYC